METLQELKALAYDSMLQAQRWSEKARALHARIEQIEALPNNGVPIREVVDTDGPLVESTA